MIRHAQTKDIARLVDLGKLYYQESMFAGIRKLNEDKIWGTIGGAVLSDEWIVLVHENDGVIDGYLIAYENWSFFEDNEMDIDFFYITPEGRGTGAARELVIAIKELAQELNIAIVYCGCHSNMADNGKNNNLFTNLFRRQGFEVTGTNLHLLLKGL